MPRASTRVARADTDRMRLAKGTWAVTLLLAGLTVAAASQIVSGSQWNTWIALLLAIVVSFLVMPPLWGWLVERRGTPHLGFAALAGARALAALLQKSVPWLGM